jgi:hypothetical protein
VKLIIKKKHLKSEKNLEIGEKIPNARVGVRMKCFKGNTKRFFFFSLEAFEQCRLCSKQWKFEWDKTSHSNNACSNRNVRTIAYAI